MSVKMTLRSAARPWRALTRHSAGTCISFGTLQSHLCFTPIALVIHLFLSHSHFFHWWVTWSAKCPVDASYLTCQGLEASFYKAFDNSLVFSEGFTYFGPSDFISMSLLSLRGLFPRYTPLIFPAESQLCDQWLNKGGPYSCLFEASCYPFLCLVKHVTTF